jgi:hypothetical protein
MAHDPFVHGVLGALELPAGNVLANVIDDYHERTLDLNLTSRMQYVRDVSSCEIPNTRLQA